MARVLLNLFYFPVITRTLVPGHTPRYQDGSPFSLIPDATYYDFTAAVNWRILSFWRSKYCVNLIHNLNM
ncbi:hypothetical protein D3C76_1179160 [compost metagenome]